MKRLLRSLVPERLYRPLLRAVRRLRRRTFPVGAGLAGLEPVSAIWGLDRGTPIERYYIERFLAAHVGDIRGRVLEIGDPRYTRRFGGGVTRSDVLNLTPGNPEATIVGDLATGDGLPDEAFDCLIVVNTMLQIYDPAAALAACWRALRPGGVLLAHFTAVARRQFNDGSLDPPGWLGEGDYWRFTSASARRLCEESFRPGSVAVTALGNVRAASAWLYGLAAEDLTAEELDHRDPRFEVAILVRAVKP